MILIAITQMYLRLPYGHGMNIKFAIGLSVYTVGVPNVEC